MLKQLFRQSIIILVKRLDWRKKATFFFVTIRADMFFWFLENVTNTNSTLSSTSTGGVTCMLSAGCKQAKHKTYLSTDDGPFLLTFGALK